MLLDLKSTEARVVQLQKALDEEDVKETARCAVQLSSRRAARVMARRDQRLIASALQMMDPVKAGRIAGYLPRDVGSEVLKTMPAEAAANLLKVIPSDHAIGLLNALDEDTRRPLIETFDGEERADWENRRDYAPGSVGAAMTTEFLTAHPDSTVEQALYTIASAPPEVEKSTYVYVVDDAQRLLGVASVRDLIRVPHGKAMADTMASKLFVARIDDRAVDAAVLLRNRRYTMLPVVDGDNTLVGVLTLDDAADILAQHVADQFSGIEGGAGDETFYTTPRGAVRRRLPWMAGNIFLNLLAVTVITRFEGTIAQVAALAAFLPMITDMGGNVGIQSLSVAIRSIALGDAQVSDYKKAVVKELVVGACNGIALGALFGGIALALRGHALLGVVAGVALGINVLVAGVVGGCLPFLIKRLGRDPAMMTGPLLTTITDVTGISIYLGLSTIFIARLVV